MPTAALTQADTALILNFRLQKPREGIQQWARPMRQVEVVSEEYIARVIISQGDLPSDSRRPSQ